MLGDEVKAVPRWNGDHRLIEPFDLCELAVEHAIRNGLTTDAMLRSYALGGRRGTHLRKVLATRPVESPATESYFETRSIQFLRELGYEDVWRQVWVTGNVVRGFKRHRVDLVIPVWSRYSGLATHPPVVLKPWHGVLFELDGKAWHDNSESFENDHDRNLAYDSWGFVHSAVTPRQLDHSQQFVANAIEQGLRRVESLR